MFERVLSAGSARLHNKLMLVRLLHVAMLHTMAPEDVQRAVEASGSRVWIFEKVDGCR